MNDNSLVSIIVPTCNSEKVIEQCLISIKRQTYSNIETMVIDNHSKDSTREIASRYAEVYMKGQERSAQRNLGASKAKGDFLFFVDSDMELTSKVVEECVKKATENNFDAIVIPEVSVGEGYWTRCKILERSCYIKDNLIEAARFFRKEVFNKIEGYDENLVAAEDWDLVQRMKKAGFSFSRVNSIIKHHEGRLSLIGTMKKKYTYGLTIESYIKKHKQQAKKQLRLIRPAFLRNYNRLLGNPKVATGMIVMKVCEFAAGACGMIVSKLRCKHLFKK